MSIRNFDQKEVIVFPVALPKFRPKILISFDTPGINSLVRIHGTNDAASIGRRVSRGCIRMRNEDILILVGLIWGKPTEILFFA